MDVRPFTRDDVPFAADLLAARDNPHPLVAPFDAKAEIEALLDGGATGYVAPGGYLIGRVDDDAAWSLYPGHAARDVATYRHLYRAISRDWVDAGQLRHSIVMPDGDRVAGEAFANLAFGREHVFALARLADQPSATPPAHVAVSVAEGDADFAELAPLLPTLARHLSEPPCFSPRPAAFYERIEPWFREDYDDPKVTYLIARVGGAAVGFATWEPLPPRIRVPEGTWALGHMSVVPEMRGRGAGQALTLAGLALGRERGFTYSWTDWRLTNMSAEPYWRTYGWRPYNVRMTRRVEPAPD
jgi:GNAT superfamily N-acetyltransferase